MKSKPMKWKSRAKIPPSKSLNRKDKRKAERQLKKQRRDAYSHRKFDLIKSLKDVDTAFKFKAKSAKKKEERKKKKKKKERIQKKEEMVQEEAETSRIQGLRLAIQKDEKELKQLEKNLNFRKKKGKVSIPTSFTSDGLDYILDATDPEKIKDFEDIAPGYDSAGSESSSELEDLLGGDDESESEDDQSMSPKTWDPDAEVSKPILKSSKAGKEKKEKRVKFAESKEDNSDLDDVAVNSSDEEIDSDSLNDTNELEDEEEETSALFGSPEEDDDDEDDDGTVHSETDSPTTISRKRTRSESPELKEDIYGRLRDADGNIVQPKSAGAYIPPAKRAMMEANQGNEVLRKQLKGLVNKVSEGTIHPVSSQVESLYLKHSRADVNETLTTLILEAVVSPVLSPERLVAELAMLVAILHSNVGPEVGAFFIQKLAKRFDELSLEENYGNGKQMENVLLVIANIYNFRVIHSKVIFDIMKRLTDQFGERDIELLLLLLKTVGFTLRKDDPVTLKQAILDMQTQARAVESSSGEKTIQSRVRFMLDILMAVRNNNMRKIPSYDPTHLDHLRKIVRNFIRGHSLGDDQLTISLEDLIKADKFGRWWIVGSAWEGRADTAAASKEAKSKTETAVVGSFSKQMLKLAKQQGMNTDVRRHIFCILGTSEDYEDAFARLLRLGLNRSQEREIIHILLHCCLNEKQYNPFYSYLAQKFCTFDRRFTMTVQFSMWDKFKEVDKMDKATRTKLGHFLSHLVLSKALSLSILKVIEFGMESKKMIRFLIQVLTEVLMSPNETTVVEVFERIAPFPKLKPLHQGLQVFMRIHLKDKHSRNPSLSGVLMQERVEKAESAMFSHQASKALL